MLLTLRRRLCHAVTCMVAIGLASSDVSALVLNNNYFEASGGDTNNVAGTIDAGFSDARQRSVELPFHAVGAFGQCTGTWIGNDEEFDKTYFLTAAHCFDDSATETSTSMTFTDYDGNVVASGTATFHVPPERVNVPSGFGGASTDIGIIELTGRTTILSFDGQPIRAPLLYDGVHELGKQVTFNGYGSWGIGSEGSNGGLFPSTGARRALGTNVIDSIFEMDHGISATFNAPGEGDATPRESAVASGDSGSAWWQQHGGVWTIIGTTNGGSGSSYGAFSTAARVSQWVDWVESIYPDVQLFSEEVTGVLGDVNQDGAFTQLDLDDFVAGWMSRTSELSIAEAIKLGDLNLDGFTEIEDLLLLQQAIQASPSPGALRIDFNGGLNVPEPSSLALFGLCGAMLFGLARPVGAQR